MGSKIVNKLKKWVAPKNVRQKSSELKRIAYPMPEPENYDFYYLDSTTKRKMTICNLFANHNKTVSEIIGLLEASPKLVIDTLLDNKLVEERRATPRPHSSAPEELYAKGGH